MANYYKNGGFSNKKINYGTGGLIYDPTAFTQSAGTISLRTMRTGDQIGSSNETYTPGPGADEITYSPTQALGSAYYTFPAIDASWDPDVDLGFVVTCSDTSIGLISSAMTPLSGTGGNTVLLDYAPPAAQAAVSWSVHMFWGQPKTLSGFYGFHQSSPPGTPGAYNTLRTSFAIRGGCVGGQIRPDFYSFYNKNINFQPSPTSVPQTWPVSVGTRGVVISMGWLDDDVVFMSQTAEMDAMLISNYAGPGTASSSASLGIGYKIFNSPTGGSFFGNSIFGSLGGNSDQASSGSMFIPVPLIQSTDYTGTTKTKRSGIWDVGASYRAKFEGPKDKRKKVAREFKLSASIDYGYIYSTFATLYMAPDGKSIYGGSNVLGQSTNVIKIPLANAWDFTSITMSGFTNTNIFRSGGKLNSIDTRYGMNISQDGTTLSLSGTDTSGRRGLFSVPLAIAYDINSANTQAVFRSMISPSGYSINVGQILQNGSVARMAFDQDTTGSPESGSTWYNYRGVSDFPYNANNAAYTSFVPKSKDWLTYYYAYTGGSLLPTDTDGLLFSNDGRYSVSYVPSSNVITVLKLNTPFDPTTHEVYDQIEFSNVSGTFPASTAMQTSGSQYKVFHYDQENDKIYLFRNEFVQYSTNKVVSIVEIS
jgi:hypothetical protein